MRAESKPRAFERVPLLEPSGIGTLIRREGLPDTPDARILEAGTRTGHEISFTRRFYQPPVLRTRADQSP